MAQILKLVICCLFLVGCNYSKQRGLELDPANGAQGKQQPPTGDDAVSGQEELSYNVILAKVLQKNCVGCHSAAAGNRGGLNLEGYQNTFENRDQVKRRVVAKTMPPVKVGTLTDAQSKLLTDWIDAGAPEFAGQITGPVEPPTELPPTVEPPVNGAAGEMSFDLVFKKVIAPSCLGCHSSASAAADLNFETYQNLFAAKEDVREQVADDSMPMGGSLTVEQKKLILAWIDSGAQEFGGTTPLLDPVSADVPVEAAPAKINFESVLTNVLRTSCLSCHSSMDNYAKVFKKVDKIKAKIESGEMPKNGTLTPEQKSLILTWISQGAPE